MESVNGFQIVTGWSNANGGRGKWAFAEKDGRQYFIKQFLAPTYPLRDGPGSPETKARKLKACEQFEGHHEGLLASLHGLAGEGGHLIVTRQFFRVGAKYYKVTDRIDTASISVEQIAHIDPPRNRVILALSLAHSIGILHRQGIVHGDLKPANILPKLTSRDVYVAKLIDFDDSYRPGDPPSPDEIVGDPTYYSPELLRYVNNEGSAAELGFASDIFALGIVLCQYFSGRLPEVVSPHSDPKAARSLAFAVSESLHIGTQLESSWPDVDEMIRSMLRRETSERPKIEAVAEMLIGIRNLEARGARRMPVAKSVDIARERPKLVERPPAPADPAGKGPGARADGPTSRLTASSTIESDGPRLKGKGRSIGDDRIRSSPTSSAGAPPGPGLKGKLAPRREDES